MSIEDKFKKLCATPSDINEHLETLFKLGRECKTIVELGVRDVVSSYAFALAKPDRLWCVDKVKTSNVDIFIDDNPLILANSDQYVDWNVSEFMYKMQEQDVDAGIVCFNSTHPKWSFAKVDELGYVTEVAEKQPIFDIATVGIYFWKRGSDYVKYAEQMIGKNIRYNNEFYVCPVFNEAISDGKRVKIFMVDKMWGIGTPEDLNYFLEHYKH